MKRKSLALGSVAAVAFACAAVASAQLPATAADPEEQVRTQQLNSQQLDTPSQITPRPDARYRQEPMRPTPAAIEGRTSLDALPDPARTLSRRIVEDQRGEPVGTVRHVVLDGDGRVVAVDVNLGGYLMKYDRIVSIDADEFVYDLENDVLVTDLSRSQLRNMPQAHPES